MVRAAARIGIDVSWYVPAMCLLVVLSGVVPGAPLVVAANRDEYRARPSVAMTLLERDPITILGGRDEVAGGTWLATNEAGLVAGLTNRPLPDGPDLAKRSRGELPLVLARHVTAAGAVDAFRAEVHPGSYNPAWLLVADRRDAFFVDVTGADRVVVEPLGGGIHVLENRNLHEPSVKVDRVRTLLVPVLAAPVERLQDGLAALLADHHHPATGGSEADEAQRASNPRLVAEVRAICVHDDADDYGTRSSTVITVADSRPDVRFTDNAPCHATWRRADDLWPVEVPG
jgi:uncharacterized protein with NRDE domain